MSMVVDFMFKLAVVLLIFDGILACIRIALKASRKTRRSSHHRRHYYNTFGDEIWQQQKRESDRFMREMDQQQFMEFSEKSVTPFEAGGFDMNFGNSFNDFGGMF